VSVWTASDPRPGRFGWYAGDEWVVIGSGEEGVDVEA
jgi:hypothetical protein